MFLLARPIGKNASRGILRTSSGGLYPCFFGKNGVTAEKREGDLATPVGNFALRRLFWRQDRMPKPPGGLPATAISRRHRWGDDPARPGYNRLISSPTRNRRDGEALWRSDHRYDLLVVIGYNDGPIRGGRGSAIFIHIGDAPTEGCVGLAKIDLLEILPALKNGSRITIRAWV